MSRFFHRALRITKTVHTLYDDTSAATLTLSDVAPSVSFRCAVTVTSVTGHTDCTGSVTIGAETLDFTTTGQKKLTTTTLTSLPTVTTSGLDCNILIECITVGGAQIYKETETSLPCKIEIISKNVPLPQGGWTVISSTTMQARGIFDIGDAIKFNIDYPFNPSVGDTYLISSIRPKVGYMGKENIKILSF